MYVVGHRLGYEGTASRLIFYKLNELGTGDEIILEGRGRIYRYQVSESFEVSPHDVWVTDQVRGRDLLDLREPAHRAGGSRLWSLNQGAHTHKRTA